MAVTTGPMGPANTDISRVSPFVPEMWADEILVAYKRANVMEPLVRKYPFTGKKGDTLHLPVPQRGQATRKVARTQVNIQYTDNSEILMVVDKHYEYSFLIEDIVKLQANNALRKFKTEDAGYQLARQMDTDLIQLGRYANAGSGASTYLTGYIGSNGTTAYNGSNAAAITDAAIRRTIQRLEDNDVPLRDLFMIVPPSTRNTLMGLARFTEEAFVGDAGSANTIHNGKIGMLYGMPVISTPSADTTSTGDRVVLIGHKDAFALALQQDIRVQTQEKLEYLGALTVADVVYGVKSIRDGNNADLPSAVFALVVPA